MTPPASSLLQAAVNVLAIAILLVYLLLAGVRSVQAARRHPRDAAVAIALAGLAFAARWFSAPRTVIGTANADLTHLVDVATWIRDGLGVHLGVTYPPAWRGMLYAVFQVFGPSLDAAFLLTTLAGALGVVPVVALARRLSGSRAASALAGLAFAAYPTAIYFANGFGLEVPASVLLVASFVHLLDWCADRRPLDGTLYALSMVAFVQTRMEGLGAAPVIVAMHVLVAVRAVGLRGLRPAIPFAAAGAALALPFLVQVAVLLGEAPGQAPKVAGMLVPVEVFLALCLVVAWDGHRVADPDRRLSWELPVRRVFTASAGLLFLYVAIHFWPNDPFVPTNVRPDDLPFYELHVNWPYGVHPDDRFYPTWLVMPGVFPLAFLVAWFVALAPDWGGRSDEARFPPTLAFLALLPWFGYYLTRLVGTGIAPVESLRHHVLYTGVVAVSIGLGAFRIARWADARLFRNRSGSAVALGAAGLVLASPVLTHRSYIADVDFDAQRELAFVGGAMASLPDHALILVPDDVLDLGPSSRMGRRPVSEVFRTPHLFESLGWLAGKDLRVAGLRAFAAEGRAPEGPAFFYQGLECHRAVHPDTLLPSCRAVREVVRAAPVAATRFPNRPYVGMEAQRIGIAVPEVDLAILPLRPDDLAALRDRPGSPRPVDGSR